MGPLSLFLGMGDGSTFLIIEILRNPVFVALVARLLTIPFDMGKAGIWGRLVTEELIIRDSDQSRKVT